MKRFILLAIAMLALAIPAMATADKEQTLSLTAPESVVTGDVIALSGVLNHNTHFPFVQKVTISTYTGLQCDETEPAATHDVFIWGQHGGDYSWDNDTLLVPGMYSFQAVSGGHDSSCEHVLVTDKVVPPDEVVPTVAPVVPVYNANVFLCYSAYQDQPGVWPSTEAAKLFEAGYWQPFAVLGTVLDGTNLGGHHLTCNLATGQSVADVHGYLGGGGEVYGADLHGAMASLLGTYPVVG